MSTWDSEDFEPSVGKARNANKWDDEDEDDDTKDKWDENDEGVSEEESGDEEQEVPSVKKKSAKEITEKPNTNEKTKAENASSSAKTLEPKTDVAKSQGCSDKQTPEAQGQIDLFEPTTKEQFDKFNELLKQKITSFEKSPSYVPFLESLFHEVASNMEADDVKKLLSTVNAVSNEKMKQQKSGKGKKKSKKATLAVGKDIEKDEIGDVDYDDFEDYI